MTSPPPTTTTTPTARKSILGNSPETPPFVKLPSSDDLIHGDTPTSELRKQNELLPFMHHEKGGSRLGSDDEEMNINTMVSPSLVRNFSNTNNYYGGEGGAPSTPSFMIRRTNSKHTSTRHTNYFQVLTPQELEDECCWYCECYQCMFASLIHRREKNAVPPCSIRTIGCIGTFVAYLSGAYSPLPSYRQPFSRSRWNCLTQFGNVTSSRGVTRNGISWYDAKVPCSSNTTSFGKSITIRIYSPPPLQEQQQQQTTTTTTTNIKSIPIILLFHEGGFCVNQIHTSFVHEHCIHVCLASQFHVISVDYRLAPEHPFPTAHQDAYDVLLWIYNSSQSFRVLPSTVDRLRIILWGLSAGGNLAFTLATLARDGVDGDLHLGGPIIPIAHLVLIYPALHWTTFILKHNPFDPSQQKTPSQDLWFLPFPFRRWMVESWIPGGLERLDVLSRTDRRCSPLLAGAKNLPPTTIVAAGLDTLRHENKFTMKVLDNNLIHVKYREYAGVPHAFIAFPWLAQTKQCIQDCMEDLSHVRDENWNLPTSREWEQGCVFKFDEQVQVNVFGTGKVRGFRLLDGVLRITMDKWGGEIFCVASQVSRLSQAV
jgi:acetyl esterase/lipase